MTRGFLLDLSLLCLTSQSMVAAVSWPLTVIDTVFKVVDIVASRRKEYQSTSIKLNYANHWGAQIKPQ